MPTCPYCHKYYQFRRQGQHVTETFDLIDAELAKELTQEQRIVLLCKRADVEIKKIGKKPKKQPKRGKKKLKAEHVEPLKPDEADRIKHIFGGAIGQKEPEPQD